MIASVGSRTCVSLTAALRAAESHDGRAAEQTRGGGRLKCAKQDVKGALFAETCLFPYETRSSWGVLNRKEELKPRY